MASTVSPTQVSSYLDYLPAIFQQDAGERSTPFLGRFLLAFEKVLSGLGDAERPGLEEIIERLHVYFDPGPNSPANERTPAHFLNWLASWVALSLREDWEEDEKRRFISRIVPLYQLRGTPAGLKELLRTYTGLGAGSIDILEFPGAPHYFQVKINLGVRDPALLQRKERIARAIIDQEKPAHTYYALRLEVPTMQIAVHSTIGRDTLLGSIEA